MIIAPVPAALRSFEKLIDDHRAGSSSFEKL